MVKPRSQILVLRSGCGSGCVCSVESIRSAYSVLIQPVAARGGSTVNNRRNPKGAAAAVFQKRQPDGVKLFSVRRRDGREAEGGGLLNRYTGQNLYRGFESLSLRHEFSELEVLQSVLQSV